MGTRSIESVVLVTRQRGIQVKTAGSQKSSSLDLFQISKIVEEDEDEDRRTENIMNPLPFLYLHICEYAKMHSKNTLIFVDL